MADVTVSPATAPAPRADARAAGAASSGAEPAAAPHDALRLARPASPDVALSWAVRYLMPKPAFARLWFGEWSQVLIGQINRNQYCFVVDVADRVHGFMGWAVTSEAAAEAWVEGRPAARQDGEAADCVIFNAWAADSGRSHRFMVEEARKLIRDKKTVYFKRRYRDGVTRPVRLPVNAFVADHIARATREPAPTATADTVATAPKYAEPARAPESVS